MSFEVIDTDKIRPPHYRFRDNLGDLTELKESIKAHGLVEPVLVRPIKNAFELVVGHRRWMATRELGEPQIAAQVRDLSDEEAFVIGLTENIQRHDLDPIEEARSYQDFTQSLGYGSIETLSKLIKKSPSLIVRRLELLKNEDVVPLIQTGKLTISQAEEMIGLDNAKASELADIAIKANLTSTQIGVARRWVQGGLQPEQAVSQVLQFGELLPKKSLHYDPIKVAREGVVSTTQQALHDVDRHIEYLPEGEERAQYIAKVRYPLHNIVDEAMKLRKRYTREKE